MHTVKRASSELPPGPLQPNKKARNNFEREGTAVSSQMGRNNNNNNNRAASAQLYDEGYAAAPREFDDAAEFQGNEFDDHGAPRLSSYTYRLELSLKMLFMISRYRSWLRS